MSKILFIILVGCIVAFASPIDPKPAKASNNNEEAELQKFEASLNSKEFKNIFQELTDTAKKIDNAKGKLSDDQYALIGREYHKVETEFDKVLEKAGEMAKRHEEGTVNVTELILTVKKFKQTVEELLK